VAEPDGIVEGFRFNDMLAGCAGKGGRVPGLPGRSGEFAAGSDHPCAVQFNERFEHPIGVSP
jgi:hypothetical protein